MLNINFHTHICLGGQHCAERMRVTVEILQLFQDPLVLLQKDARLGLQDPLFQSTATILA